jgi:hypothetical protein
MEGRSNAPMDFKSGRANTIYLKKFKVEQNTIMCSPTCMFDYESQYIELPNPFAPVYIPLLCNLAQPS